MTSKRCAHSQAYIQDDLNTGMPLCPHSYRLPSLLSSASSFAEKIVTLPSDLKTAKKLASLLSSTSKVVASERRNENANPTVTEGCLMTYFLNRDKFCH